MDCIITIQFWTHWSYVLWSLLIPDGAIKENKSRELISQFYFHYLPLHHFHLSLTWQNLLHTWGPWLLACFIPTSSITPFCVTAVSSLPALSTAENTVNYLKQKAHITPIEHKKQAGVGGVHVTPPPSISPHTEVEQYTSTAIKNEGFSNGRTARISERNATCV